MSGESHEVERIVREHLETLRHEWNDFRGPETYPA
jgi:hypothetical protein